MTLDLALTSWVESKGTDKVDIMKVKACASKDTINGVKRQQGMGGNICRSYI